MTRTERTYYLVAGGYNLAQFFLAPIYPLFLLSRGLDLFEINAVFATYLFTTFLFDIPTGAIADRFGRKTSFVLACAVRTAAFLLYTRTRTIGDCIEAEILDGIGATLAMGALDAWAVDGARAEGDHRPSDRMFARVQAIAHGAMIVGAVASGYIGERDLTLPWYVAAAVFAVTGVVGALTMRDPPHVAQHASRKSLRATTVEALTAVATSRPLLLLCALTLAGAFAVFPVYHYWQPRLQALTGQGPWLMGWVLAAINVLGFAGNTAVPRLVGRFGRAPVLAFTSLWRGASIAVAAAASGAPMLIGGILLHGAGAVTEPVLIAWTNEHVDASARATVLSVRSTFLTLGGAVGLLSLGVLARAHGIPAAWTVSATVLLLLAPGYLLLARITRIAAPDLAIDVPVPSSKVSAADM